MRPYPEEVLRSIQSGIVAHFAPEVQSTTFIPVPVVFAGFV